MKKIALLFSACALLLFACKKDDNSTPTNNNNTNNNTPTPSGPYPYYANFTLDSIPYNFKNNPAGAQLSQMTFGIAGYANDISALYPQLRIAVTFGGQAPVMPTRAQILALAGRTLSVNPLDSTHALLIFKTAFGQAEWRSDDTSSTNDSYLKVDSISYIGDRPFVTDTVNVYEVVGTFRVKMSQNGSTTAYMEDGKFKTQLARLRD